MLEFLKGINEYPWTSFFVFLAVVIIVSILKEK